MYKFKAKTSPKWAPFCEINVKSDRVDLLKMHLDKCWEFHDVVVDWKPTLPESETDQSVFI